MEAFTEKYFYEEITRFRKMLGDKLWWEKSIEQRNACIRGLSLIYISAVNDDGSPLSKEQVEKLADHLTATLNEYNRRAFMLRKES